MRFAAAMEASIRQQLELISQQAPTELQPVFGALNRFQVEFELLIDRVQYTDADGGNFPPVEAAQLLGADDIWQQTLQRFAAVPDKDAANLTMLWMVHSLMDKSAQFYQQAAGNKAHPGVRLMLSSLAEIKNMQRRRIGGLLRVMYNQVWADVGFAPFALGKD
jgi:hypothetical protein